MYTKHGAHNQLSKTSCQKPGPQIRFISQGSKDGYSKPDLQAKGRTTQNPSQEPQARIHIGSLLDFGAISYIPAQTGTYTNKYNPHVHCICLCMCPLKSRPNGHIRKQVHPTWYFSWINCKQLHGHIHRAHCTESTNCPFHIQTVPRFSVK